jgi:hypothetical protein
MQVSFDSLPKILIFWNAVFVFLAKLFFLNNDKWGNARIVHDIMVASSSLPRLSICNFYVPATYLVHHLRTVQYSYASIFHSEMPWIGNNCTTCTWIAKLCCMPPFFITDGMFQRLFMISYLDEEILVCLSHTDSNQQNHTSICLKIFISP